MSPRGSLPLAQALLWVLPRGSTATQRANPQGCKKSRRASQKIGRNQQLFNTHIPGVGWGNAPAPLQQFCRRLAPSCRCQLDPGLCWVKLGRIVPEGLSRWSEPTADIARASPKAGVPAMLRFTPLGPRSVGHAWCLCPQEGKKALSSPLPGHGRYTRAALGFVVLLLRSPPDLAGVGTEQPRPGCASQLRVPSDVACFWGAGIGAASRWLLPEISRDLSGGAGNGTWFCSEPCFCSCHMDAGR